MVATTSLSKLSWVEAQPGSIHLSTTSTNNTGRNDADGLNRQIWFRHQTLLEYFSANGPGLVNSIQLQTFQSTSSHHHWHDQFDFNILKAAVRQLRFDHPAIALRQAWSALPPSPDTALLVYQVPRSESDIDEWLATVLVDHSNLMDDNSMGIDQKIESLTYELGKPNTDVSLPLFRIHYIPASSGPESDGRYGLVFVLNHALFDAIGSFQIMDLVVARIANALTDNVTVGGAESSRSLPWGQETTRLPPALGQSARIPSSTKKTVEDEEMLELARRSAQSVETAHTLPIPHPNSLPSPSSTGVLLRKLPPSLLNPLRNASRTHGCTIFNVLLSAMAISFIRIRPLPDDVTKKNKNITLPFLFSPVDARSLACDDPYNKSEWKVRLSMGFFTHVANDLGRFIHVWKEGEEKDDSRRQTVTDSEDLWVLAKEIREQSEKQKKYMERLPVWVDELLAIAGGGYQKLGEIIKAESRWYPILSSIGVMDKYLSRTHPLTPTPTATNEGETSDSSIIVSSPRLAPVFHTPFAGGCLALHAFTWDGELALTFSFPEGEMGTPKEQERALREGRRNEDAIVLEYVNEFMNILEVASGSKVM